MHIYSLQKTFLGHFKGRVDTFMNNKNIKLNFYGIIKYSVKIKLYRATLEEKLTHLLHVISFIQSQSDHSKKDSIVSLCTPLENNA
jgi:hypothetical protein